MGKIRRKNQKARGLLIVLGYVLVIATSVYLVTGAATAAAPAEPPQTLVIGVSTSLSGPAATWGMATYRGAQYAADDINAAGGLKAGGKTYKVKMVSYDNKFTSAGGAEVARKLISDDKAIMLFAQATDACFASLPITNANKVIQLNICTGKDVNDPRYPYSFRAMDVDDLRAANLYKYVKENLPQLKTITYVAANNEMGRAIWLAEKTAAERNGIKILGDGQFFERGTTDFSSIVGKMLALNPDMLGITGLVDAERGLFKKQAYEQGWKGWFVSTAVETPQVVAKIAGEGYWKMPALVAIFDITDPSIPANMVALGQRYITEFKEVPPVHVVFGYDAITIYTKAVTLAGGTDPDKVKHVMETQKFKTMYPNPVGFNGRKTFGYGHELYNPSFISRLDPDTKKLKMIAIMEQVYE